MLTSKFCRNGSLTIKNPLRDLHPLASADLGLHDPDAPSPTLGGGGIRVSLHGAGVDIAITQTREGACTR